MYTLKKIANNLIGNHPVPFFLGIIAVFILIGTVLFYIVEDWSLFNSFYFTSVTMSTIGYGDITPVTHLGKIIAIIYGFMGAPLFIGFTGLLFQNKFHNMIKKSIHAYHKEVKETEKIALQAQKHNKIQDKEIKEIQEEVAQ